MHEQTEIQAPESTVAHPQLRPSWVRPPAPNGFPKLVALNLPVHSPAGRGSKWFLEFYNPRTGVFASEVEVTYIDWPWREGFVPTGADWDFIGVMH